MCTGLRVEIEGAADVDGAAEDFGVERNDGAAHQAVGAEGTAEFAGPPLHKALQLPSGWR